MRKIDVIQIFILAVLLLATILMYPQLPERMATHWNIQGQANGYMDKLWGALIIPVILVGIVLLFAAIPKIDPLRANIDKFRVYYDRFVVVMILFLSAIQGQVLAWNVGIQVSPNIVLPMAIGLLLFFVGDLCQHAKRNWFIGIRTPWTLSSDRIWEKTNRIGGKLFKATGMIAVLGVFFPDNVFYFILLPIMVVTIATVVYSYLQYRKETKKTKKSKK